MSIAAPISIRELDSRLSGGVQVRLLWDQSDSRVWVSVLHTRNGHLFDVEIRKGERPVDVFNHPFAYAAHHGIDVERRRLRRDAVETVV